MVRVRLKGVHKVRVKLANGSHKTYWYAWRGGPRLLGAPGSPEFVRAYQELTKNRHGPREDTVAGLMAAFRTTEYDRIGDRTREHYEAAFRLFGAEFGDMTFRAVTDPRARAEFKRWRDRFADRPRTADMHWQSIRRLFSFAVDQGMLERNPCAAGGRLWKGSRRNSVWTPGDVARLEAASNEAVWRGVRLAFATALRLGDLVTLTWGAWDGQRIRWEQSKTHRRVAILMDDETAAWLDGLRSAATSTHILTSTRGTPWTPDGLKTSFGKAKARAQIKGLTFHDIRGTVVTRDYVAGATIEEIMARYGWSRHEVSGTLERHYLGDAFELGDRVVTMRRK